MENDNSDNHPCKNCITFSVCKNTISKPQSNNRTNSYYWDIHNKCYLLDKYVYDHRSNVIFKIKKTYELFGVIDLYNKEWR